MITSTLLPGRPLDPGLWRRRPPQRRGGFTLVEILIGSALSAWVLAGVLTVFLFLGRSGANIANYSDMESQARRSLEQFAQDTRQASAITWISPTSVQLNVDLAPVVYEFTSNTFVRKVWVPPTASEAGYWRSLTLLSGITTFSFKAYKITGEEIKNIGSTTALADASKVTKQLQISLQASRTSQTVTTATNTVLSARFILRNKKVTA